MTTSPITRFVERLRTAVHADTSNPHRLSLGWIGGDIPVFPPLALLLTTIGGLLAWFITKRRCRLVHKPAYLRVLAMAVGVGMGLSLAGAVRQELERVGTEPNFAEVTKVATQGPFQWTRNGMYLAVLILQTSLAIGLDTGWLVLSQVAMFLYLDRIVIPAEELFLTTELGDEYLRYCETVPRWLGHLHI